MDEIGGLSEAIQQARKLAGIGESKKTRVVHYLKRRRLWEKLMPDFRSPIMTKLFSQSALDAVDMIDSLERQKILLLMPFQIRIR